MLSLISLAKTLTSAKSCPQLPIEIVRRNGEWANYRFAHNRLTRTARRQISILESTPNIKHERNLRRICQDIIFVSIASGMQDGYIDDEHIDIQCSLLDLSSDSIRHEYRQTLRTLWDARLDEKAERPWNMTMLMYRLMWRIYPYAHGERTSLVIPRLFACHSPWIYATPMVTTPDLDHYHQFVVAEIGRDDGQIGSIWQRSRKSTIFMCGKHAVALSKSHVGNSGDVARARLVFYGTRLFYKLNEDLLSLYSQSAVECGDSYPGTVMLKAVRRFLAETQEG